MKDEDENFTADELVRYQRHFALKEVGPDGQEKLKNARVLCVGAGGFLRSATSF